MRKKQWEVLLRTRNPGCGKQQGQNDQKEGVDKLQLRPHHGSSVSQVNPQPGGFEC